MTRRKKWLPAEFYGASPLVLMHSVNSINHSTVFCSNHGDSCHSPIYHVHDLIFVKRLTVLTHSASFITKWSLKLTSSNKKR
jgi:hypothetical protein